MRVIPSILICIRRPPVGLTSLCYTLQRSRSSKRQGPAFGARVPAAATAAAAARLPEYKVDCAPVLWLQCPEALGLCPCAPPLAEPSGNGETEGRKPHRRARESSRLVHLLLVLLLNLLLLVFVLPLCSQRFACGAEREKDGGAPRWEPYLPTSAACDVPTAVRDCPCAPRGALGFVCPAPPSRTPATRPVSWARQL